MLPERFLNLTLPFLAGFVNFGVVEGDDDWSSERGEELDLVWGKPRMEGCNAIEPCLADLGVVEESLDENDRTSAVSRSAIMCAKKAMSFIESEIISDSRAVTITCSNGPPGESE